MESLNIIKRLIFTIDNLKNSGIELEDLKKKSLDEFKDRKKKYYLDFFKTNLELLKKQDLDPEIKSLVLGLSLDNLDEFASKIIKIQDNIKIPEQKTSLISKDALKYIPYEIKNDIFADSREIEKCFSSGCFRSVAVLCGRILEVALHWKYYKVTGIDLLEKSPGIGLGKIVAKLSEKEFELDPGLSQQIHLINQVRVFSVHVKQNAFNPNKAQANAMILYSFDIIEKIFKK